MVFPLFELPESPVRFIRHGNNAVTLAQEASSHDVSEMETVGKLATQLLIVQEPDKGFYSKDFIIRDDHEVRTCNMRAYFGKSNSGELYITDIEVEDLEKHHGSTDRVEYRFYRDGGVMFAYNWGITLEILEQINDVLEATIRLRLGMSSLNL